MPHSTEDPSPLRRLLTKVSSWFWSLTPTCREVARLTSEERDHPLPPGMRLRLRLHRAFCRWCARYARQLDFLHTASERFPEEDGAARRPGLDGKAKARLKAALQRSGRDE